MDRTSYRKTLQIEEMKQRWEDRIPNVIERRAERHSSVLLPLIEKNGELEVLFEVRASSLSRQPNEICFPGGRVETGESFEDAAVRETAEELLINREQVEIVAPLDYLNTSSGLTVHAYLGHIHDYMDTYSLAEVDHVFTVPLSWFLEHDPECYQCTVHTIPNDDFPFHLVPGGRDYHWRKGTYSVFFYQYKERVIWGMTAKLLYAFIKLYNGDQL